MLKLDGRLPRVLVVIGVGAAWLVDRTDLPLRRIFAVLLVLPLAIPDFVGGYAWVSLDPAIHGYWGAVHRDDARALPVRLPAGRGDARRVDPALEEVARSLGLGRCARSGASSLPQLRPAILGGAARHRSACSPSTAPSRSSGTGLHDGDLHGVQPRLRRRRRVTLSLVLCR